MASSEVRRRRKVLMSAPQLSRLPRVDSSKARKDLISPLRREATDMLRQEFLQSRHNEFEPRSRKLEEFEHLKRSVKLKYDTEQRHGRANERKTLNSSEWLKEIRKANVPERLPIARSLRIKSAAPVTFLVDKYKTTNPLFYRSYTNLRTGRYGKNKLQYFINKDWSSEKLSWTNFHQNVPEFHKVNWVC